MDYTYVVKVLEATIDTWNTCVRSVLDKLKDGKCLELLEGADVDTADGLETQMEFALGRLREINLKRTQKNFMHLVARILSVVSGEFSWGFEIKLSLCSDASLFCKLPSFSVPSLAFSALPFLADPLFLCPQVAGN